MNINELTIKLFANSNYHEANSKTNKLILTNELKQQYSDRIMNEIKNMFNDDKYNIKLNESFDYFLHLMIEQFIFMDKQVELSKQSELNKFDIMCDEIDHNKTICLKIPKYKYNKTI